MTAIATSDAQVEQLVCEHLHLVHFIVHELSARYPSHVDRQDLWSAGAMGLVEAARRFLPENGVPFANYARRRIRGAILDSTRSHDWASRGVRRNQRELDDAAAQFAQAHNRPAMDADLAASLGVDEAEVVRRRAAVLRSTVLHLDQTSPSNGDAPSSLADTLAASDDDTSPEAHLEQLELIGALRSAVRFLTERQRDVIERYYFRGEQLRDIADSLGVTEARVSQLRSEAVTALQTYLDGADYLSVNVDTASLPGKRQRASFVARVTENSTWRDRLDAAELTFDDGAAVGGMR